MRLSRSRVAAALLAWTLPARDVEAVIGDLEEEYRLRSPGSGGALRWYWLQVLRSTLPLLWMGIRRDGVLPSVAIAVAACVMQGVIELAINQAGARLFPPDTPRPNVLSPVISLLSLMGLSYLATRMRAAAGTVLTAMVVVAVALQIMLKGGESSALWGRVPILLLGMAMTIVGVIASHRTRPS